MLDKFIDKIIMSEPQVNKDKVLKYLTEELSQLSHKDTNKLACCIYKRLHHDTLIPGYCEEFIKDICDPPKWELSDTNSIANKLKIEFDKEPYTAEEFRVAMHLVHKMFYKALKENSMDTPDWGRLADAFLDSKYTPCLVEMYFHHKEV